MQRLKKSLAQKAAPKRPERPSYGNFGNVTQDLYPLTTKWHYPLISMHLKGKDWRRFWGKKAAPKVPE